MLFHAKPTLFVMVLAMLWGCSEAPKQVPVTEVKVEKEETFNVTILDAVSYTHLTLPTKRIV